MDITRRSADKWIVDFGWTMTEKGAALYEAPFQHAKEGSSPVGAKSYGKRFAGPYGRLNSEFASQTGIYAAVGAASHE